MNDERHIYILGGGTFSYVRNHLALATPAFGQTARKINDLVREQMTAFEYFPPNKSTPQQIFGPPRLCLTKMANHHSDIITNDDVAVLVDKIINDKRAKIVFFNVAMCDFDGYVGDTNSDKHAQRLKSREGIHTMVLTPADKLIGRIRKERKDIFLVGFKTTTNYSEQDQYVAGLNLLKANSCNLVLANDTVNRRNMIIVPEEAKYCVTDDRDKVLTELVKTALHRSQLTFTRSTVVPGDSISWNSDLVPANLRAVVNHCIAKGAYKRFRGATAGHFAVKLDSQTFLTSKRKTDYNNLDNVGLVKIVSTGHDSVIAHGHKPSVGGQSQRIVFDEHPNYDCIVHFHCPPKPGVIGLSIRPQQLFECGSHECGKNTSGGLELVSNGIKVVYLDNHGPNIVFNRSVPPEQVISFIDRHFDLAAKTGGYVT